MTTTEDRLGTNIAQARKINRAIIVALLVMGALLVGWNWPKPADAATKPKVAVRYDVGSLWNVPAAVKGSGLPTTKVSKVRPSVVADCSRNCVVVFDIPDRFEYTCDGFPTTKLLTRPVLVCKWAPNSATVMLSNATGKKLTPAQRQAALTAAFKSLR